MANSFYPPPSSHHSVVYPNTPIPSANFLAPQMAPSQHLTPNVVYVPSRSNSHRSHRSHHSHAGRSNHGHQHDDDDDGDDYDNDRDRDRYHHDQDRYHHDRHHDSGHRSRRHSHRDRDRDDRKHRRRSSRRRHRDRAPQITMVPGGGVPVSNMGAPVMSPHGAYGGSPYYYRPTWTQRLRQFFGLAPASPYLKHKSNTHSWGFLGRSRRPRYVDAYTGVEVDKHGRQVIRV